MSLSNGVPPTDKDRAQVQDVLDYLDAWKNRTGAAGNFSTSIAFFTDMNHRNRFLTVEGLTRVAQIAAHVVGISSPLAERHNGYMVLRCTDWSTGVSHPPHEFEIVEEQTETRPTTKRYMYCPGLTD